MIGSIFDLEKNRNMLWNQGSQLFHLPHETEFSHEIFLFSTSLMGTSVVKSQKKILGQVNGPSTLTCEFFPLAVFLARNLADFKTPRIISEFQTHLPVKSLFFVDWYSAKRFKLKYKITNLIQGSSKIFFLLTNKNSCEEKVDLSTMIQ